MDIAWSGTAKKLTGNCLTAGIFVSGEQEEDGDITAFFRTIKKRFSKGSNPK